jgi:hypothetical protein
MLKILLIMVSIFSISGSYAGGVLVGNGGSVVRCGNQRLLSSLDYVLTKNLYGNKITVTNQKSLQASLSRISNIIALKLPKYKESFDEYTHFLGNTDSANKYLWIAEDNLEVIHDEIVRLPYSCTNYESAEIQQAIIRQVTKNNIIFKYDEGIYLELERQAPLQLSFLVVHEWLWNFMDNVKDSRMINYFLHSNMLMNMPSEKVIALFKIYGFEY